MFCIRLSFILSKSFIVCKSANIFQLIISCLILIIFIWNTFLLDWLICIFVYVKSNRFIVWLICLLHTWQLSLYQALNFSLFFCLRFMVLRKIISVLFGIKLLVNLIVIYLILIHRALLYRLTVWITFILHFLIIASWIITHIVLLILPIVLKVSRWLLWFI